MMIDNKNLLNRTIKTTHRTSNQIKEVEIDSAHFKKKTRQALDWNPHEHRKWGRPKHTCRRGLEIELKKIDKT